ncbi:MAG TPA: bifunctional DNA primase/polymerase [Pyrinomonadaceae bacterium]|jgi:hypothetical protein
MRALIRRQLLQALNAPPRVLALLTAVSDYMEALQTSSVRFGLELIAQSLGHPGQVKYSSRVLDEKQKWEARLNIQTCSVKRGQRNVRRATEFFDNRLNEAAEWIFQQVSNEKSQLHTVAKIDEHCEQAIVQFLRRPLTTAAKTPTNSQTAKRQNGAKTVVQAAKEIAVATTSLSASGELALSLQRQGYRVFPVDLDLRRPRVTVWQQRHSEQTIRAWANRWLDTAWGITCGTQLRTGGYLVVIDKDRHGETFGDGFKTVTMRESDLGSLPPTLTSATPRNGEHCFFSSTKPLPSSHDLLGPGLDCKALGGFVIAPGGVGYPITDNLPIARLPIEWERALMVVAQPKKKIAVGERHDYLRGVAFAMACQGKQLDEILRTLRQRQLNCESGGRIITDTELEALASSAVIRVSRAEEMMRRIVA